MYIYTYEQTLQERYQYLRNQLRLDSVYVRYCSWFWTDSEGHKVNSSGHQVISIFMGKGVVYGIGVGQKRAALAKGFGQTFSEELISETKFEE